MDWTAQLFNYCERGTDPAFWAEPFNAISNAAFLVAALLAGLQLRQDAAEGARLTAEWVLVALAATIGIGSFMFHTFATRWAVATDVGAIFAFTFAYFGYALRRYFELSWTQTFVGLAALFASFVAARFIPCDPGLLPVTAAAGKSCLNGSPGYMPVLVALVLPGIMLVTRAHPAAWYLLAGALIFAVSLLFRTVDVEICELSSFLGRNRGTHSLWHILNGATVYVLLLAAIRVHVAAPQLRRSA